MRNNMKVVNRSDHKDTGQGRGEFHMRPSDVLWVGSESTSFNICALFHNEKCPSNRTCENAFQYNSARTSTLLTPYCLCKLACAFGGGDCHNGYVFATEAQRASFLLEGVGVCKRNVNIFGLAWLWSLCSCRFVMLCKFSCILKINKFHWTGSMCS